MSQAGTLVPALAERPCFTRATSVETSRRSGPLWPWGLALAMLLGAVLRLVCIEDIEYKVDEAWIVTNARFAPDPVPLRWIGLPASIGINNPALGTWVFRALSLIAGAQTPPEFA